MHDEPLFRCAPEGRLSCRHLRVGLEPTIVVVLPGTDPRFVDLDVGEAVSAGCVVSVRLIVNLN